MNILDEQIPESQRQLLSSWRVLIRQIGHDTGQKGLNALGAKGWELGAVQICEWLDGGAMRYPWQPPYWYIFKRDLVT